MTQTWPVVRMSGKPHDRGLQYGEQAAGRIRRSVEIYTRIFDHYAGLSWPGVLERVQGFAESIDGYDPELLVEMEGIAEGAGVGLDDILALNLRTEVMFGLGLHLPECTAVVALPEATADLHTILAQNWDWKPDTRDTCVLLAASPASRPGFVTLVEAGLLAKAGMNDAGIGLATNALICDRDRGGPGVPYHAVLRRILTAQSFEEAVDSVRSPERSSSANYLIAHRDGYALDIEAAPGGADQTYELQPDGGILSHANHFQSPRFPHRDIGLVDSEDSPTRQRRSTEEMVELRGVLSAEGVQRTLRDHVGLPSAVCSHPDPDVEPVADYVTVSSIVMDLTQRTLWVSAGRPCDTPYDRYALGDLLP